MFNRATGEVYELLEPVDPPPRRIAYNLGGRHGQFSVLRVMEMLSKESGLTGDAIRVFLFCGIRAFENGGATANEAAAHLGLTPQATRRIARMLAEHKCLLVAERVGRTIKYRASPHIISSLSGEEQAREAAAFHLPTVPGRPDTKEHTTHASPSVPGTRSPRSADRRTAAPETERGDAVRDPGRLAALRREDCGRAG
ncbi:MarR family transcriptional regulator [Streptomyces sp. NPDC089919]|uniref:MarR family transcriptional regulator n=1 Tax=Streptomyces sp. NPDC089919 TaxID=3155188 RepID=UPI003422C9A6